MMFVQHKAYARLKSTDNIFNSQNIYPRETENSNPSNNAEVKTIKRKCRFNFIFDGTINRYRVAPSPTSLQPALVHPHFCAMPRVLVINVSHKRGNVPACT